MLNVTATCQPRVITTNNEVIGFFLLDLAYSGHYDFCLANSIGLRSFLISNKQQGQDFGESAMLALKPYLAMHYAEYHYIYLTLNCKNPRVYHCYLSADFADMNSLYLGGTAGPQHIMRLEITK